MSRPRGSDWEYVPYAVSHVAELDPFSGSRTYFRFGSRTSSLSREEQYISWLIDHGLRSFIDAPEKGNLDFWLEERTTSVWAERLVAEAMADWEGHLARYPAKKERMIEAADNASEAAREGQGVAAAYRTYTEALYSFCEFIWMPWAAIRVLEKDVLRAFPEHMDIICALGEPIEYVKMRRDALSMTAREWLVRYAWMKAYNVHDEPYGAEEYALLRKDVTQKEIREEIARIEDAEKAFRAFIATVPNPRLRRKAEIVHKYIFLRTDRIDSWKRAQHGARGLFEHVARLVPGATLQDAANMAAKEIIVLLEEGKRPFLMHLKTRSRNEALYYFERGKLLILTDAERIRAIKRTLVSGAENLTELRGLGACGRKAKGKVCLVATERDLAKIQLGDILVAKFTQPRFTPAMHKAAAIVTDEGGIVSHAALISRELGLPCVIGTRIATEVFKDGDLVEVDAEKGIVRRLDNG